MDRHRLARAGAVISIMAALAGCTSSAEPVQTPGLEPRGTVLTTVKPTRQDLTNEISLAGKVTINPVFGIVAPADGEIRYLQLQPSTTTATTRARWVATVWKGDRQFKIKIPKGSTLAGRLMQDRATVTAGMPVVSARHTAYGIVADIDSAQAYRISGAIESVQGQIKNGPGPFPCTAMGTIAALPAGTMPEPPAATPSPRPSGQAEPSPRPDAPPAGGGEGSEPTGLRLVCTAPEGVKLINGAAVTLDVVTDRAADVLVLPVEAVAGTQGKGKVDLVGPDRTRKTVDVTLGLTDGKFVEIKSGLSGDETVAIPGPNLPAAAGGQGTDGQGPEGQPAGGPG